MRSALELELHPRRRVGVVPDGTPRGGRNEVEIIADISMDQILAKQFAKETQVASLELSMDMPRLTPAPALAF